ncbi:MAG: riboflavin synthase [Cyanobacteria bacterium SIG26]|nr:riboflavin synthase [Cyanobacteria bacterium SIG26]
MFTGIIEETGIVKSFSKSANCATLEIFCREILNDVKLGDSIAIDGVCQTVVKYDSSSFTVQISNETLKVTNFANLKNGKKVNLERALTLNSRLGGHIVSGHVDGLAKFIKSIKMSDFYEMEFEVSSTQEKYIVHKGSITINGISLTVASVSNNVVKVAVIPHTYLNTTLSELNLGDFVNVETDILGKYVEKFLSSKDNSSKIDMRFLCENGFV